MDFGLTTAYGSVSAPNSSQVTSHAASLGALTANTLYHYRARSRDAAGNLALSGDTTFTTLAVLPAIYALLQRRASVTSNSLNPLDPESRYYVQP